MNAIVYTTNTGYTKQYAEMLSKKTGIPCFSFDEAKGWLVDGLDVIYLGWIMKGTIKGYKEAAKKYNVKLICAVGIDARQEQYENLKKINKVGETPFFVLQGGLNISKLSGMQKLMMKTMIKIIGDKLEKKSDITDDEKNMIDLLKNGGSRVSEEKLEPIIKEIEAF